MHILEIPSFFTPYGGEFCLDQAKALKALGHEVRILSNVQLGITIGLKDYLLLPYRRYEHQRDDITVYQSYQRGLPRMVRHNVNRWVGIVGSMFRAYVRKYGKPDIIHAHCGKWAGYAAMKSGKEYGIPYVITEHLPLLLLAEEYGPAPSNAWQIPFIKEAYHEAAMVLPVSEELVGDMACYYGSDYRWQYLSNAIDTDFFAYRPRAAREGRPFRFCCLADYTYRKGYDVLFAAFQKLQNEGLSIKLLLAGKDTDSRSCCQEIARMGLLHVKAMGRIGKQEVRALLYESDALVLASRSEVQPLVLLEAMSTGIPVVSTECIPQNLRIEGGSTIVSIADAEALATAMKQVMEKKDSDGRKISESVRQTASLNVVGQKLSNVFSDILAST
ncbi:MAG: glycosyltransferase [Prevotella sp.]|nr:glycosyltransferase [Prevotella sp.]